MLGKFWAAIAFADLVRNAIAVDECDRLASPCHERGFFYGGRSRFQYIPARGRNAIANQARQKNKKPNPQNFARRSALFFARSP